LGSINFLGELINLVLGFFQFWGQFFGIFIGVFFDIFKGMRR